MMQFFPLLLPLFVFTEEVQCFTSHHQSHHIHSWRSSHEKRITPSSVPSLLHRTNLATTATSKVGKRYHGLKASTIDISCENSTVNTTTTITTTATNIQSSNSNNDAPTTTSTTTTKQRFYNSLPKIRIPKIRNLSKSKTLSENSSSSSSSTKTKATQEDKWWGDETDQLILQTAIPSMLNFLVVPLVNSVDTFWVGRLGVALALAGQAAANQAFFTIYFLVAFLPNLIAPLVATSISSGDTKEAQNRIREGLFLSNLLGGIGTLLLVGFPQTSLRMVLPADAPAMPYAVNYARLRSLSMMPALWSATGTAAYRGLLDTVTPLKVSLVTNLCNLVADPLLIFGLPFLPFKAMGISGAAVATAGSEMISGVTYLYLLLKKKLLKTKQILSIPSWERLKPLVIGGFAMLMRQLVLNVAFLGASRKAQMMDRATGIPAAAYGIVMQVYSLGVVCHLGMQSTAAALVPAARAKGGDDAARAVADRMMIWGVIVGAVIAIAQFTAQQRLLPMFSTIPEVQEAVKIPALISSLIQFANGPLFVGEGIMLGLGLFKALSCATAMGVGIMLAVLATPLGQQLNGILIALAAFNVYQAIAMVYHYLKMGPLSKTKKSDSFVTDTSDI